MDWQLPSKAKVTLYAREMRDYLRDLISLARPPFCFPLLIKTEGLKYDHIASSGGLCPLFCQRLHQQLGVEKEMHILDNSQTLTPLI